MDPRLQTPLLIGGVGLVLFLFGSGTAWSTWNEPQSPVLTLPVVDGRTIGQTPTGAEVLAEGKVAASAAAVRDGLVVVIHQVATGETRPGSNEVRFTWDTKSLEALPFDLETSAGALRVQVGADTGWADAPRLIEADPGTVIAGKQRLSGFGSGDAVTVHGTLNAARGLEARLIRGGSVADYRTQVKKSGGVGLVVGGALALFGLIALISAAVEARKVFNG